MIAVEREPRQLIVAAGLMIATTVIQATAVVMLEKFVWLWRDRVAENTQRPRVMAVLCGVILYLFALHVAQISIWAAFYLQVTTYPTFAAALYESGLAFTTLDVPELPPAWKFLGPAEGIAGLLMFAWSTAVMFNQTSWISEARRRYFRISLRGRPQ
jgi:hypothetical protein